MTLRAFFIVRGVDIPLKTCYTALMKRDIYIIGTKATEGDIEKLYYAEGWMVPAQWTYRSASNYYTNKRDAIKEAKKLASPGRPTFVEIYHNPFGQDLTVWSSEAK